MVDACAAFHARAGRSFAREVLDQTVGYEDQPPDI
jgi:hypothetical protein